jgi:hypothetical protein
MVRHRLTGDQEGPRVMSISTTSTPRTGSPAAGSCQTWAIGLTDASDAVVRVLSALRRRRCTIVGVDFARADRHRPGHLVVSVVPPSAHAHCVARWIAALVDVDAAERVDR